MTAPNQTIADLVDAGVLAYRNRDFKEAIGCLQQVLDNEPRNWRAKLYLAMCYYNQGEIFTAHNHFAFLRSNCTDNEIRAKAEAAIAAMGSQLNAKMPEMTCTIKRADLIPKSERLTRDPEDEHDDVEVVVNKDSYYNS